MAVSSNTIGKAVIDALGLPVAGVTGITVSLQTNQPVEVLVRYLPSEQQVDDVIDILKRYELHEKPA